MIIVRSENGKFLGEVKKLNVLPQEDSFLLIGDAVYSPNGKTTIFSYEILATYKTTKAAIKQIDDMQKFIEDKNNGLVSDPVYVPVYDLRECKIREEQS